ncbi:hypothetical protein R1flu_006808 [Riccia fluitans]|uniref:Secreted protein n=1 Tax=Riccia fluitans TaxID=41844 RepID=A0ABD1YX27_9MARC
MVTQKNWSCKYRVLLTVLLVLHAQEEEEKKEEHEEEDKKLIETKPIAADQWKTNESNLFNHIITSINYCRTELMPQHARGDWQHEVALCTSQFAPRVEVKAGKPP